MLPLTSFFYDVLSTKKGDPKYYQIFLSQYTLMTIPIIISQGSLTPGNGPDAKAELEEGVDMAITEILDQSSTRRKTFEVFTLRALSQLPPMIQSLEDRTFFNHLFYEKTQQYQLSNREMILGTLNSFAFTSYFALLEDTLQKIHFETFGKQTSDEQITGRLLISSCLKKILKQKKCTDTFLTQLALRSEFYANFDVLCKTWNLLNFLRNKLAHFGGRITPKALETMQGMIYDIFEALAKEGATDHAHAFAYSLHELEENIKKTGLLQFNNTLENIMRNTCSSIVESILICDRQIASRERQQRQRPAGQSSKAQSASQNNGKTGSEKKQYTRRRSRANKPASPS